MFGVMHTQSGRIIDLENIQHEDVDLEDIIWHHSRHPRWNSATRTAVSVADHVLFCDDLFCMEFYNTLEGELDDDGALELTRGRLDRILHDGAETYTTDLPTGAKPDSIRKLQAKIDIVIRGALGIDWCASSECLRKHDRQALLAEARAYMHPNAYLWARREFPDFEVPAMSPPLWGMEAGAVEMRTRLNECLEVVGGEAGEKSQEV